MDFQKKELLGWRNTLEVRNLVNKKIEALREKNIVGSSLQAEVKISAPLEIHESLDSFEDELKFILITSEVSLSSSKKDLKIEVKASKNKKCDRCWHYVPSVGMNSEHPSICQRCISNLFEEGEERNHA